MSERTDRELRRILVNANRTIRTGRTPHIEDVDVHVRNFHAATGHTRVDLRMYQMWFRTRGCTYDRAGQCSMCNYGIGPEIDPDAITRSVGRRLTAVPEGAAIYLSPSGSLLDDREVPASLREQLLRCVAARRPVLFAFESRPEVFTHEKLAQLRELLPSTAVVGQVGVESWDPRVRALCHLKPTPQSAYLSAAGMLAEHGFDSIANLTLGGLGLSQREAYDDTLAGVRAARAAGYTTQMIFPLSAKSGTLLGWAHDEGHWQPPTLWMLVRLLAECADDTATGDAPGDLSLSWFDPKLNDVVQARPDACVRCRPVLVEALSAFRVFPRSRSLAPLLDWHGCDCPDRTADALRPRRPHDRYPDRVRAIADHWLATHPTTAAAAP